MSGSKERNVSAISLVWDPLLGQESEQYHFAHAIGPDDITSEELFSLNFGVVLFADMIGLILVVVFESYENLSLACAL
jgi:hypothetical protein